MKTLKNLKSVFLLFYNKIYLKECDVWWELVSDEIIVMLVTPGLPSSFLSLPVV